MVGRYLAELFMHRHGDAGIAVPVQFGNGHAIKCQIVAYKIEIAFDAFYLQIDAANEAAGLHQLFR